MAIRCSVVEVTRLGVDDEMSNTGDAVQREKYLKGFL